MDDRQLQQWVEQISLSSFGRPFEHKARFNRRLRATGGRYFTRSHDIEISWHQYEQFGMQDVEKIIKHELCHYHLHLLGSGYQHRDDEFKQLLTLVGGTRYCQSLPSALQRREPYRYKLVCVDCRAEYLRKRKTDPRRFVCGHCKGKLKLLALDLSKHS
ncbi:SprT family protein [Paenibacillus sp. tmac-D7]|uniref:SprT family protein n=1 Tax=Paenibacillus sp. tmac-D7 TaxID=2591462 RepID=UPI00114281F0|nr:SprT family protein [Paenibacillus sp. tmac-D7]